MEPASTSSSVRNTATTSVDSCPCEHAIATEPSQERNVSALLADLDSKLQTELQIKSAAAAMLQLQSDRDSLAALQLRRQVDECDQRIQFCRTQRLRLARTATNNSNNSNSNSNNNNNNNNNSVANQNASNTVDVPQWSTLDLATPQMVLTAERIAAKLQDLNQRLQIELKVKEGADTYLAMLDQTTENGRRRSETGDEKKRRVEIQLKLKHANDRITLLKAAIQRYAAVHVAGLVNTSVLLDNKRPVTAMLVLNIGAAVDCFGTTQTDAYVAVRVDHELRTETRSVKMKNGKFLWNETVSLLLENAIDLEVSVCARSDHTVLGFMAFRLAALRDRLDQVVANIPSQSRATSTTGSVVRGNSQTSMDAAPTLENDWELDPSGKLSMRFSLLDPTVKQEKASSANMAAKLRRHAAVRKRKQYVINGHTFQSKRFYQIMKCALCGDVLMTGLGYQCDACQYLVHKKCHAKVFTKCISRAEDSAGVNNMQAQLLKHNVPHRFDLVFSKSPAWCCHCGYILPIGKVKRCSECNVMCHTDCDVYIPNLCGMSLSTANMLLVEAERIQQRQKLMGQTSTASSPSSTPPMPGKARKRVESHASSTGNLLVPNLVRPKTTESRSVSNLTAYSSTTSLAALAPESIRTPRLEDFSLVAVLGRGNFGKVMLVQTCDPAGHKRLYAMKALKKEFILQNEEIESTKSERRVFMTINRDPHPFLVRLHSCFQSPHRIFFVMEYVRGGDLMWHIQHQPFTEYRAKFYACEVLLALEHFHKHGIVYRDLKLDNVLLTLDGHIKLADYGLCKEKMNHGDTTSTFCGTPEFIAPEILLERPYTRSVDWWAFGVLVYEMLLGQAPFQGESEDEIFESILRNEALYPSDMPRDAVLLIRGLLTKDPIHRLGSGPKDAFEIKNHAYFKKVKWDDVYNCRIPVPFVPRLSNDMDVSNFDAEFTRERACLTPIDRTIISESDQEEFRGFDFVSDFAREYFAVQSQPLTNEAKVVKQTDATAAPVIDTNDITATLPRPLTSSMSKLSIDDTPPPPAPLS